MSKSTFPIALMTLIALVSGRNVDAQQNTSELPQAGQSQPDQNQPGRDRSAVDPNQQDGASSNMHGDVTVKNVLIKKLQKSNEGEIELAKIAVEKSESTELRQFAQMLIKDHESLNQRLGELSGEEANQRQPKREGARTTGGSDQTLPRPKTSNELNQDANKKPDGQAVAQEARTQGQSIVGKGDQHVVKQLMAIMDQACDKNLEMTKEMLQKYEGQDFHMAFLGQQIVAHTAALAEIQAIEASGPKELQELARQASTSIQGHLQIANQLAKKFEDEVANQQSRR